MPTTAQPAAADPHPGIPAYQRSWRGLRFAGSFNVDGMATLVEQVGDDPVTRVVGFVIPGCSDLAAAAPVMLATLRAMDGWLANTNHGADHPWRLSLQAAIATAEGRAEQSKPDHTAITNDIVRQAIEDWRRKVHGASGMVATAERLYLSTDPGTAVHAAAERVLLLALGELVEDQVVDLAKDLDRSGSRGLAIPAGKDGGGKGRGSLNCCRALNRVDIHGSVPSTGGSDKSAGAVRTRARRRLSSRKKRGGQS